MTDPIKAKIQELCPDVMELKFGCEIRHFLKGTAIILNVHKYDGESDCYDLAYYKLPEMLVERSPRLNWEILGSPITLAVVLQAMSKVGVMTAGANALINIIDVNAPDIRWNLEHDNYDAQTQETKDFIGSLLNA